MNNPLLNDLAIAAAKINNFQADNNINADIKRWSIKNKC